MPTSKRKRVSRDVPADIADEFETVGMRYCHAKQQNVVMAAAMLMFLEADPEQQAGKIKEVFSAQVDLTANQLVDQARARQAERVSRDDDPHQGNPHFGARRGRNTM
jgi:hypothetical protein